MYLKSLLCCVSVLSVLLLGGCEDPLSTKEQEVLRPVKYVEVYRSDLSRERSFSGTAEAGQQSRMSFKVAGSVAALPVSVGDALGKGDVIARLDDQPYRLKVQEAQAALEQGNAQLRNAQATYERVRALYVNRNASKSDLDNARAAAESAKAAVGSIAKRLEQARLQLSYTVLEAPIAGSVAAVMVQENENVQAGTPIVLLTSVEIPEVTVSVPEMLITQIRQGEKVTVRFGAIPGKVFDATVTEVGVASVGMMTTFPVTVKLAHADPAIRPGMAAEAVFHFQAQTRHTVYLLPPVAVSEDTQGRYVYVVEATQDGRGMVHRKAVTVGDLTDDGLEIVSGLQDGEKVVIAGVSKIGDGMTVKLPE